MLYWVEKTQCSQQKIFWITYLKIARKCVILFKLTVNCLFNTWISIYHITLKYLYFVPQRWAVIQTPSLGQLFPI